MTDAKTESVAGDRVEGSAVAAELQEVEGERTAGIEGCRVKGGRERGRGDGMPGWLVENWQEASDTVRAAQMRVRWRDREDE